LVLALFAKVLQVVPLTLVWVLWVLWEQLGLVFLLDLSVWKQLDPLVVLQVVPLDEVASGEVALFLKVPPTLVWVLWVLWEQLVQGQGLLLLVQGEGLLFQLELLVLLVHMERGSWEQGSWGGWEQLGQLGAGGPAAPIMAYWQGARATAASTAAVFTAAEASAAESLANSRCLARLLAPPVKPNCWTTHSSKAHSRRICSRSRSPDGAFPALLCFGPMAVLRVRCQI
jgi:hypothetical protein